jgi:hypothetical protein
MVYVIGGWFVAIYELQPEGEKYTVKGADK